MILLKKFILPLFTLLTMGTINAQNYPSDSFYLKVGTGVSFAQKAHVNAADALWDPANQGYNSRLGERPILAFGLGFQPYCSSFSADLTYSFRPQYKYRKFQTTVAGSTTTGNLGAKTREMDLDVSSIMLSGYWSGKGHDWLTWRLGHSKSTFCPFLGFGVGVSRITIYNFRSTGLPAPSPAEIAAPSFGSSNEYTVRTSFTYQLMGGLEYNYCDLWTLSLGYRWFDAGRYKGPSFIRTPLGTAADSSGNEWRSHFRAQEVLLELKVPINR